MAVSLGTQHKQRSQRVRVITRTVSYYHSPPIRPRRNCRSSSAPSLLTSRQQARNVVTSLTNQEDSWKQNLVLLGQSKNQYALHFAASQLTNALTTYLNSFTPEDREQLRRTLLSLLADLGPLIWGQNAVRPALLQCLCRLQKLCWFDDLGDAPEKVVLSSVMPFMQASLAHSIIGLDLMLTLVTEISVSSANLSAAKQRKIAVRKTN